MRTVAATVKNTVEGPRDVKNRGYLGGAAVWYLPLAHVAILETWDRIPRRTHSARSLLLPLPVSLHLSVTIIKKIKKEVKNSATLRFQNCRARYLPQ